MAIELRNKAIIITGASSAGIGAATAIECAKAGMNLVLNARRADKLEATAERARSLGVKVQTVPGDVADEGVSQRMIDAAVENFGGFYGVFANAGYGIEKAVIDCTPTEWRRIFDVNFFASIDLCQRAARWLVGHNEPGHLLMCSSCLAKFTLPYYSAYSATKAAQSHACFAMRAELKPNNIHVSSVHPITTQTEFFEVTKRGAGGTIVDEHKARAEKAVPDHSPKMFVQSPERVAKAVVTCLKHPKPEVWTSFIVRFASSLFTLSPGLAALALDRKAKHKPAE